QDYTTALFVTVETGNMEGFVNNVPNADLLPTTASHRYPFQPVTPSSRLRAIARSRIYKASLVLLVVAVTVMILLSSPANYWSYILMIPVYLFYFVIESTRI